MSFYAVRIGRKPGIYRSWPECEKQVRGYSGAKYKKFNNIRQAQQFIDGKYSGSKSPHPDVGKTVLFGYEDIIVYTDGACRNNGKENAKAGFGVYSPTNPDITCYGSLEDWELHTNQRAELLAIHYAIERAPDTCTLQILSDSIYSINCITKWSIAWERAGWNVDKANLDLIRPIVEAIDNRNHSVEFTHVKGHSGEVGNEEADRLANLGANLAV